MQTACISITGENSFWISRSARHAANAGPRRFGIERRGTQRRCTATAGFDEIGEAIAARFEHAGVSATIRFPEARRMAFRSSKIARDASDLPL